VDVYWSGSPNIQGFRPEHPRVNVGQTIFFKSPHLRPSYRIDIYRLGDYQGMMVGFVVTSIAPSVSLPQIHLLSADISTGMIDLRHCGDFVLSASWTGTEHWPPSGIYLPNS